MTSELISTITNYQAREASSVTSGMQPLNKIKWFFSQLSVDKNEITEKAEKDFNLLYQKYLNNTEFADGEKYDLLISTVVFYILNNREDLFFFKKKKALLSYLFYKEKDKIILTHFKKYGYKPNSINKQHLLVQDLSLLTIIDLLVFSFFNERPNAVNESDIISIHSDNSSLNDLLHAVLYLANGDFICAGIKFNSSMRYVVDISESDGQISTYIDVDYTNFDFLGNMADIYYHIEEMVMTDNFYYDYALIHNLDSEKRADRYEGNIHLSKACNLGKPVKINSQYYALEVAIKNHPQLIIDKILNENLVVTPWSFFLFETINLNVARAFFKNLRNYKNLVDYEEMKFQNEQDRLSEYYIDEMAADELNIMREETDGWLDLNIE